MIAFWHVLRTTGASAGVLAGYRHRHESWDWLHSYMVDEVVMQGTKEMY